MVYHISFQQVRGVKNASSAQLGSSFDDMVLVIKIFITFTIGLRVLWVTSDVSNGTIIEECSDFL